MHRQPSLFCRLCFPTGQAKNTSFRFFYGRKFYNRDAPFPGDFYSRFGNT